MVVIGFHPGPGTGMTNRHRLGDVHFRAETLEKLSRLTLAV